MRKHVTRREFLGTGLAAAGLLATGCIDRTTGPPFNLADAELLARPGTPTGTATVGSTPLGIGTGRDGFLYVPTSYQASVATPLLILLHGAGQTSAYWTTSTPMQALADEFKVILLAPDSRDTDWDLVTSGTFNVDVDFIDQALTNVFKKVNVHPNRVGMCGFSDGASYALSLGIINGDFISAVIAHSPAAMQVPVRKGSPRVFISHGTEDAVSPVTRSRDGIVPALFSVGLNPHYVEFTGGHVVPAGISREAVAWFVA
jgi:phospholipase/carboxylesterase